jgi:phage head maturation protease
MDLLDVNALQLCEVSIVERHALSGTRIRKLSDIEGFRSVSEFRKQYLYGEFTGNLLFRED